MNGTSSVRRLRRRLGPLQKFLTILLTAVVISFGLMIFFRVSHIEVEGNNQYADDLIAEASGIAEGENLIMINKGEAANLIKGTLPYVTEIKMIRKLPDTVVIYVTESGVAAVVTDVNGASWDIDYTGKALQQAKQETNGIAVIGFTPRAVIEGEAIVAAEGDEEKLNQLKIILQALASSEILSDVSAIDLTSDFDPVLTYDGIYTVKLGSTTEINYKLRYLLAVREKLTDNQSGTIDLTFENDEYAHFRPDA